MEITEAFDLPGTVDQIWAALADPAYHAARAASAGATSLGSDVSRETGCVRVVNQWRVPAGQLPPAVRAVAGAALELVEEQRWQRVEDGLVGQVTVAVAQAQVRFEAQATVVPHGQGCRQRVAGRVTSAMPFLGAQAVAAAGPVIAEAVRSEAATAAAWLSRG